MLSQTRRAHASSPAMHQPQPIVDVDALRELLVALVRAPSVNPPGDEGPVAMLMAERLERLGLETRTVEARPGRPSVIARLRGTGDGPTLLLNGHMDVQPPGSRWTRDPFAASVEGTTLYGQGAMDMKAGLAAMVTAVELLRATGTELRGDLLLTAVADEVCGGHLGTGWLVSQGLVQADMAVVCEPTGPAVRVAHRGALWLEIEVTGRSAHGGRPWLGVNAIGKLNRILVAIEDELAPSLRHRTHPLLPAPTFNVGTLKGGTKFNLVADRAVAQVDRRMLPGETAAQALGEVRGLCEDLRDRDEQDWEVTVTPVMHVRAGEIDADAPIVEACRAAHRKVTGMDAAIAATAGFEDAHFLLDAGIPTAMFGPYRPVRAGEDPFFTNSGMADECVDLDDVARAAQVYAQLIRDLIG
jgi:acetylornithine deacetylase/succinyl-diaminopimelate desuccinylase family protein